MKSIEEKELVLRITGEVQASNLAEFEQTALEVIRNINTSLSTDAEFAEAKENIKSCKTVEIRIANAKQQAIMSMEAVAEMMTVVDRLQDKFRDVRLMLEKTVKTEEARRKKEITDTAIKNINNRMKSSPVTRFYDAEVMAAIKGKRSLQAMQEAVDDVVYQAFTELDDIEAKYKTNIVEIEEAEREYPGLFPDKKTVALQPTDTVIQTIEARVAKFRLAQKEKEEAEVKRLAEEKAEIDRFNAAEVERHAAQVEPVAAVTEPPVCEIPPDPFLEANIPPPPVFDEGPHKVITVRFVGSSEEAQAAINMLLKISGVTSADWDYA